MTFLGNLSLAFEEFCKSLRNVEEVSQHFSNLITDNERCECVLNLYRTVPTKLFLDSVGKNSVLSKDARDIGNKKYASAQYDHALECYTKSISFAPVGSPELMLALGNRAACLLNLGFIAEALVDVQRALALPIGRLYRREYNTFVICLCR